MGNDREQHLTSKTLKTGAIWPKGRKHNEDSDAGVPSKRVKRQLHREPADRRGHPLAPWPLIGQGRRAMTQNRIVR